MDVYMNRGAPYMYDYKNAMASRATPTEIHAHDAGTTRFYRRYLLQQAMSVFQWKLPEHWSRDYFLYVLYCWGFIAVVNTDKYGVIPQACGLGGYTVQYQPRYAIIANELLGGNLRPIIDEQCTLFKLQPDFGGIMDLVNQYAELLSLASEALSVNLINSKLAYVFTAGNKNAAESLKKVYDEIASGKPAVVVDKQLLLPDGNPAWQVFQQDLKSTLIAPDLLLTIRQITEEFLSKIGIPNANKTKRERLNTEEVTANNVETYADPALWLESLQESARKTRDMFGLSEAELSVDWREDLLDDDEEGGEENVSDATDASGSV